MAQQQRIFISHSAKDEAARSVRDAVAAALKTAPDGRYAVLMDKVALEPGDTWRARINLWLGSCDAAVLILSPDALTSPYVGYEVSVLGYRKSGDPSFLIIPVLVGVTMDEVKAARLAPAQVGEWQKAPDGTPAEVAASVAAELEQHLDPRASRPLTRMAQVLESYLPRPGNDVLRRAAAARLEFELLWQPYESDLSQLSFRLLGSGMSTACAKAIRALKEDPDYRKDNLSHIVQIVASAWVDLRSDRIMKLALAPSPPPIVLNATRGDLACMYLDYARYSVDILPAWRFKEANTAIRECADPAAAAKELIDAVTAALLELLDPVAPEKLESELQAYAQLQEPIVIGLRAYSFNSAAIAALRDKFKTVTFFLLGGDELDLDEIDASEAYVVRPPLLPHDEIECLSRYAEFDRNVQRR